RGAELGPSYFIRWRWIRGSSSTDPRLSAPVPQPGGRGAVAVPGPFPVSPVRGDAAMAVSDFTLNGYQGSTSSTTLSRVYDRSCTSARFHALSLAVFGNASTLRPPSSTIARI